MEWLDSAAIAALSGVFVVLVLRAVLRWRRRAAAYGIEGWRHRLGQLRDGIGIRDSRPQAAEESANWPEPHVRLLPPPREVSKSAAVEPGVERQPKPSPNSQSDTHSTDAAPQT